jgi:hypothetical protein
MLDFATRLIPVIQDKGLMPDTLAADAQTDLLIDTSVGLIYAVLFQAAPA